MQLVLRHARRHEVECWSHQFMVGGSVRRHLQNIGTADELLHSRSKITYNDTECANVVDKCSQFLVEKVKRIHDDIMTARLLTAVSLPFCSPQAAFWTRTVHLLFYQCQLMTSGSCWLWCCPRSHHWMFYCVHDIFAPRPLSCWLSRPCRPRFM